MDITLNFVQIFIIAQNEIIFILHSLQDQS